MFSFLQLKLQITHHLFLTETILLVIQMMRDFLMIDMELQIYSHT
jgi:hypothetical protein